MEQAAELQLISFLRQTNPETAKANPVALEEYSCKRGDVKFYLLLSRQHRNMRVLDYRIGNYQLKRAAFDHLAKEKGLRKIFTLVEKQDSNSWRTVGFSRESVVPAYFRTADAYVMSRVYDASGDPLTGGLSKVAVAHEVPDPRRPRKPKGLKLSLTTDREKLAKLVSNPSKTPFYTPFGKGVTCPHVGVQATVDRKKFWVVAEINDSFGHAKLDLLSPLELRRDVYACVFALERLFEYLSDQDVAGAFTFVNVDDELANEVFASADFRYTGQLTRHVVLDDGEPVDMHTWHYRLRPRTL